MKLETFSLNSICKACYLVFNNDYKLKQMCEYLETLKSWANILNIYVDKTEFTSKDFSNLFLQLLNLAECILKQEQSYFKN